MYLVWSTALPLPNVCREKVVRQIVISLVADDLVDNLVHMPDVSVLLPFNRIQYVYILKQTKFCPHWITVRSCVSSSYSNSYHLAKLCLQLFECVIIEFEKPDFCSLWIGSTMRLLLGPVRESDYGPEENCRESLCNVREYQCNFRL